MTNEHHHAVINVPSLSSANGSIGPHVIHCAWPDIGVAHTHGAAQQLADVVGRKGGPWDGFLHLLCSTLLCSGCSVLQGLDPAHGNGTVWVQGLKDALMPSPVAGLFQ